MLGELPANRVQAYYEKCHRRSLRNFCNSYFVNVLVSIVLSRMIFSFSIPNGIGFLIAHNLTGCVTISRFFSAFSRVVGRKTAFSMVADLICLLKKVQIQYHVGVFLGSFLRQAIALRGSWVSETCARGRLCAPPDHWPRDFFVYPPSDANFPEEVANKFDDGQPWFDFIDRLSDA